MTRQGWINKDETVGVVRQCVLAGVSSSAEATTTKEKAKPGQRRPVVSEVKCVA